jgi:hypothetical protein
MRGKARSKKDQPDHRKGNDRRQGLLPEKIGHTDGGHVRVEQAAQNSGERQSENHANQGNQRTDCPRCVTESREAADQHDSHQPNVHGDNLRRRSQKAR